MTCKRCHTEVTDLFPSRSWCYDCERHRNREDYWKHRDKRRAYANEYTRMRNARLREDVLDLLGGVCTSCGLSDRRLLGVDHIHGGGRAETRAIGPHGVRSNILKDPTGYQLLCSNCHTLKTKGYL